MKDQVGLKGEVGFVITKADGTTQEVGNYKNTISTELKTAIATSLQIAQEFGALNGATGDAENFIAATENQAGIVALDTAGNYWTAYTRGASSGNTAATLKLDGTIKANSSKTIASFKMGHGAGVDVASTGSFSVDYATNDPSDIALVDGDQLDITWTITLADN